MIKRGVHRMDKVEKKLLTLIKQSTDREKAIQVAMEAIRDALKTLRFEQEDLLSNHPAKGEKDR